MENLKAYILFPGAAKNPLYAGWLDDLALPVEIVKDYNTDWNPPADAGILITHSHYRWEELSILRRVKQQESLPILILVDGILEYRNSFQHPDLTDGSMFQPLVGHKLACIGDSQVRWTEAWGNTGKCELVGLPRLDYLADVPKRDLAKTGPFRVLVASARTPWFDDKQRELTYAALTAVKKFTDENATVQGRPLEMVWRMAEELHLNLRAPGFAARPEPIRKILDEVDAVITTPSTLQLEAAALGLPVAVADFHNNPQMTPMAWTISHEGEVAPVITELANPPSSKCFIQDVLLNDSLQLRQPAAERMGELVSVMVREAQQARRQNRALHLPDRILPHPTHGFVKEQPGAARQALFPDNPIFANEEVANLQTELAAAVAEMGNYPEKYFQQRSMNQRLRGYINWLRLLIRNRAATIEELSSNLQHLQASDGKNKDA
ncbi:MAG: hypothetical protein P8J33_09655, partial [Pirellulaceae bacterium]|nr:hypothetical protein [Pirellulaceae bacterium]